MHLKSGHSQKSALAPFSSHSPKGLPHYCLIPLAELQMKQHRPHQAFTFPQLTAGLARIITSHAAAGEERLRSHPCRLGLHASACQGLFFLSSQDKGSLLRLEGRLHPATAPPSSLGTCVLLYHSLTDGKNSTE